MSDQQTIDNLHTARHIIRMQPEERWAHLFERALSSTWGFMDSHLSGWALKAIEDIVKEEVAKGL